MELPSDIIQNIIDIITYCAAAAVGWIAKWFTSKKKNNEQ